MITWQGFLRRFSSDPVAIGAALVLLVMILMAVFAPLIAPQNPYDLLQLDIMDSELRPSWQPGGDERFWLGTDAQGRGVFSTILYGTGISLLIGIGAVIVQGILGVTLGLWAGYKGGWVDSFLMRIADIQMSLSTLMIAIIALALFQAAFDANIYADYTIFMLILIIGVAEWPKFIGVAKWPKFARTVRLSVLGEKDKEYVDAARVIGLPARKVMWRHILPNALTPVMVISTIQVAEAIMTEAELSFLGLGMPTDKPSLGSLIRSGFEFIFSGSWWITLYPAVVLVTLVLALNLLGDWLRDVLNPKLCRGDD